MRKKIILVLITIIVTGCSADYNLEINKDSFKENLNIKSIDGSNVVMNTHDYIDSFVEMPHPVESSKIESEATYKEEGTNYYDVINHNYNSLTLSAKLTEDELCDSSIIKTNIGNFTCDISEDEIVLGASLFKKFEEEDNIQNITVNIKTKLNVTDNNADSVKGDTYTWNINKNNYDDKEISMTVDKNSILNVSDNDKQLFSSTIEMLLVFLIFLVPVIILIIMAKIKAKGKNKI